VRGVHLLGVEPGVVLLVLVTEGGRVHQSIVRCPAPVTPGEVSEANEALAEALVGKTMPPPVDVLELGGLGPTTESLVARALDAIDGAADAGREIYVGGASRMVDLWEDLAKLHRVLALLEREATVLELLDESAEGTTVRLGAELPAGEEDLAVVSARYVAGRSFGRMGVLGPMRMDYRRTIRVVEEVSDALGDSLGT
jgi:heat-inducible transcriptional repressor